MQTIYLDISNKGVIPCIQAKQNEVGRKFLAVITDSGVPYEIKNDSVVSVWYDGASGKGNYTDIGDKPAISVSSNRITVELIAQMLSVSGDGVITVLINSVNGDQIGLWNIDYCVEEVAGVGSEKAEEYYTAFSQTAASLAQSAKTIGEKQDRIDSIIKAKNATVAGLIYPLASANVPSGFLLCDGSEYSRTEYEELFDAIGTTYGVGDGQATFNVPNLCTRVPVGAGENYALGAVGGEETHRLTIEEMPSHNHGISVAKVTDGALSYEEATALYNSETTTEYLGKVSSENNGSGLAHSIMQPYTVVNYIISTGKEVEFVIGVGGADSADLQEIGAELYDIRTGFDGKTYASAGEAVRGQASKANDGIKRLERIVQPIAPIVTLNDYLANEYKMVKPTGEYSDTPSNISVSDSFFCYEGDKISGTLSNQPTSVVFVTYDKNGNVVTSIAGEGYSKYTTFEHTFTADECTFRIGGVITKTAYYAISYYPKNNILACTANENDTWEV